MEILTTQQAWADFYAWVKDSPQWKGMGADEKQKIKNTGQDVKKGNAGPLRVGRAFTKYRPGVYVLNGWWTKKD